MDVNAERILVQQVLDGDSSAFAPLVEKYQRMVYNLALRTVKNPDDAEDAAQEAFIKCYRSLRQFRWDSAFSVWLHRLTYNVCLDMLRRKKREKVVLLHRESDDGEEISVDIPDFAPTPEQALEKSERIAAVRNALKLLSDEHCMVLVMREIDGLSYDEIAERLGLSLGTVKSRINRARISLRKELEKQGNFSFRSASNTREGGMDE